MEFPIMETAWVFPIWAEMFILMIVTRETPWSMPCVPGFYGMKKFKRGRPPGWVILFIMWVQELGVMVWAGQVLPPVN